MPPTETTEQDVAPAEEVPAGDGEREGSQKGTGARSSRRPRKARGQGRASKPKPKGAAGGKAKRPASTNGAGRAQPKPKAERAAAANGSAKAKRAAAANGSAKAKRTASSNGTAEPKRAAAANGNGSAKAKQAAPKRAASTKGKRSGSANGDSPKRSASKRSAPADGDARKKRSRSARDEEPRPSRRRVRDDDELPLISPAKREAAARRAAKRAELARRNRERSARRMAREAGVTLPDRPLRPSERRALEHQAGVEAPPAPPEEKVEPKTDPAEEPPPRKPEEPKQVKQRAPLPRWQKWAGIALGIVGVGLLLEMAVTLVWQEPFTAWQAGKAQAELSTNYDDLVAGGPAAPANALERAEDREVDSIRSSRRRVVARMDRFARRLNKTTPVGKPLGRIRIPKIDSNFVFVQGTDPEPLTRGPGHYRNTQLPGQLGTLGIAGHRTTYKAPFKRINELQKDDDIWIDMPYGRFRYKVMRTVIVQPGESDYFNYRGFDRIVLSACHPLESNEQRILAIGALVDRQPTGWAVAAERARARRAAKRERISQLAIRQRQL